MINIGRLIKKRKRLKIVYIKLLTNMNRKDGRWESSLYGQMKRDLEVEAIVLNRITVEEVQAVTKEIITHEIEKETLVDQIKEETIVDHSKKEIIVIIDIIITHIGKIERIIILREQLVDQIEVTLIQEINNIDI